MLVRTMMVVLVLVLVLVPVVLMTLTMQVAVAVAVAVAAVMLYHSRNVLLFLSLSFQVYQQSLLHLLTIEQL